MTINKLRRAMYQSAKVLGDVQAITHDRPSKAIPKRIGRRITGNLLARIISGLFPPIK